MINSPINDDSPQKAEAATDIHDEGGSLPEKYLLRRNSGEPSYQIRNSHKETWNINFIAVDPEWDLQLHYRKLFHSSYPVEKHIHERSAEAVYVMHGEQSYNIDGKIYHVRGGEMLVSPPGLLHFSADAAEWKGDFYYMTINPECVYALIKDDDEARSKIYGLLTAPPTVFSFREPKKLNALMKQIKNEYFQRQPCLLIRLRCDLCRLLLFMYDTVTEGEPENMYAAEMEDIYLFIEDHIYQHMSVEDVARHTGYSKTALQNKFKTWNRQTVHEYILNRKIDTAKQLILDKNNNPYGVWQILSFSSQQYFSHVFKRFTGMTVTQFLRSGGG